MQGAKKSPAFVLFFLFLGMFVTVWNTTSIKIMLPDIMDAFNVKVNWLTWVVNAYSLPYAIMMPLGGKLGDMFGPKRFFTFGVIMLAIGSIICGTSINFAMLLAGRVIQGLGGAFLFTNGLILVLASTPVENRGTMLGLWGSVGAAGGVAGPILAGFLMEFLPWRGIFLTLVPMAALVMAGTVFTVKEKMANSENRSFDLKGAVTLMSGTLLILLGISTSPQWGWFNPMVLLMYTFGIILLFTFFKVEKSLKVPMVDIKLFRHKIFTASMLCGFIAQFAVAGTIFVMPIFFEKVQGFGPTQVALMLTPVALSVSVIGPFAGRASDRLGFFLPTGFGMFVRAVSFLLLSMLSPITGSAFILLGLTLNGVGFGLTQSPLLNAAVSVAREGEYGMASGVYSMIQYVGGAVGVAVIGALLYSGMPDKEALASITGRVPGFSGVFLVLASLCLVGFLVSLLFRTPAKQRDVKGSKVLET